MKDKLSAVSSVLLIFLVGCLFGCYALWINLRVNSLESNQVSFQKGVEQFAKQINDEFAKRPVVEKDKK